MALRDITTGDVLKAVKEFQVLGRKQFIEKYGFGKARSYFLDHEGALYDSKAIVGAAHAYACGVALSPAEFSGGQGHAVAVLEDLGFTVLKT